jgi:DNA-binding transcriptional LysR family regulator
MFNWDDMRFFLELARRNKLSRAALRLGVEHTTVARRITALEEKLSLRLFERKNRSYQLTDDGRRLLTHAEAREKNSLSLLDELEQKETSLKGKIRVATPEAFGSQFIAKHCHAFQKYYPGILFELVAETTNVTMTRRDADIAITLAKPERGRFKTTKIGSYRLRLYAAPSYLQGHPPIVRLTDLNQHNFIWYVDDLLLIPELHILDKAIQNPNIVFSSTNLTAQANAAEKGLGIALLPCFVGDQIQGLTPVLPGELSIVRDLWLSVHQDQTNQPIIDKASSFLSNLIASERRTLIGV